MIKFFVIMSSYYLIPPEIRENIEKNIPQRDAISYYHGTKLQDAEKWNARIKPSLSELLNAMSEYIRKIDLGKKYISPKSMETLLDYFGPIFDKNEIISFSKTKILPRDYIILNFGKMNSMRKISYDVFMGKYSDIIVNETKNKDGLIFK